MNVPARDSVIGRSLRLYGEWAEHEIASVAQFLTDGPTIVDVGANIGVHTLAFATLFPNSKIVALEPQPDVFSLLAQNVALNPTARNVVTLNVGAGAAAETLRLMIDYESLNWNFGAINLRAASRAGGSVTAEIMRLDELLDEERIQFLKFDIEGMEPEALAGSQSVISRHRPIIFFEVLSMDVAATCTSLIAPFDYKFFWLETSAFNTRNFRSEALNIWTRTELAILAVPNERADGVALPPYTGDEAGLPQSRSLDLGYTPVYASACGTNSEATA
jgi:FkbM family methyltransferase